MKILLILLFFLWLLDVAIYFLQRDRSQKRRAWQRLKLDLVLYFLVAAMIYSAVRHFRRF